MPYYDVLDGKPDKRTKLYKTLEKHACFAEFAHAEEQELVAWLERRAKALGCTTRTGRCVVQESSCAAIP